GERLPAPAARARALRLGAPPETRVPIALAALSPGSIRLAGELADAWTPFLWARSRLDEGRELAGTRGGGARPVALRATARDAHRLAAWWLTTYLTRMGPLYPRLLAHRFGFAAGVEAILDAALADRHPELPEEAEALAGEVTLLGTYAEAGDRIGAW